MKQMQMERLQGSKSRYTNLFSFEHADEFGLMFPETLQRPFEFRWEPNRGEGRILLRETILAIVNPAYREHYRESPYPVLSMRRGIPDSAKQKIYDMVNEACDLADAFQKRVKESRAETRAAVAAVKQEAETARPVHLFSKIISTHANAQSQFSMEMPRGGTARALSGLSAMNKDLSIILERGHDGSQFRVMLKNKVSADFLFNVRTTSLETEETTVAIKVKMNRKMNEDALKRELQDGMRHWDSRFSEAGLMRSIEDFLELPTVDVPSMRIVLGEQRLDVKHVESFGHLSLDGIGTGSMISLKYKDLNVGSFMISRDVDVMTGKFLPIDPGVIGHASWVMNRDVTQQMEARWRCGFGRLNPDDFPDVNDPSNFRI